MGHDHRRYEVRITGEVPEAALVGLDDIRVARQEMRSVVSGEFPDQAALYGFLNRLRSLGLEVLEVRQLAVGPDPGSGPEDVATDSEQTTDHEPAP